MSQKKAAAPQKPVAKAAARPAAAKPAAAAPAAEPTETRTVAYDPRMVDAFIMGRITIGELEGIDKDVQYGIAQKGFAMLSEGKLDLAKTIFKGLIALDPYDSYFHTAFASALQREGRYEEAEAAYSRALQFNPVNSTAFANRGEIRFQLGRVMEAAEDLRKAVEHDKAGRDPAAVRARVLLMAISETIRENQDTILKELQKAQADAAPPAKGAKPAGKAAPGKPAPKGAAAKAAPARPAAKPAAAKAPAKPAGKK